MAIGNIKHRFRIRVEANDESSRAVGILKVAEVFEQAGIHLSSDLNTATAQLLAKETSEEKAVVHNNELLAIIAEPIPAAPVLPMYPAGVMPAAPGMMYGGGYPNSPMPNQYPGQWPNQNSWDYPSRWGTRNGPQVFTGSPTMAQHPGVEFRTVVAESVGQTVFKFNEQISAPIIVEHVTLLGGDYILADNGYTLRLNPAFANRITPGLRVFGFATRFAAKESVKPNERDTGNIPGYEHNPMAKQEHIPQPPHSPIGSKMMGKPIPGNWPNPMPLGLKYNTHVTRLGDESDSEVSYDYAVYGWGARSGWHELAAISLQSHVAESSGPNNPRVEDLLLICADHLRNLKLAEQSNLSQDAALLSIQKALQHLHGGTVQQHLGTQAPKEPPAEASTSPSSDPDLTQS